MKGIAMHPAEMISVEVIRLLARVGLLAASQGKHVAAEDIFIALQAVRPREPNVAVCRAVVLTSQERFAEAADVLREVVKAHPGHMGAKSTLGFALHHAGQPGWRELLDEVVAEGRDASAVTLARQVLGTVQAAGPAQTVLFFSPGGSLFA